MTITDVHTHTKFSHDGLNTIDEMLAQAEALGVKVYGISEHFDYDYIVNFVRYVGDVPPPITNPDAYFPKGRLVQKGYEGRVQVLIGVEFGYTDNPKAIPMYENIVKNYRPDFVINSIHSSGHYDFHDEPQYFDGKGGIRAKEEVYADYLRLVKSSLNAPYPYDIVGHFTYVTRYAPYADKRMTLAEYGKEIDEILSVIIEKGKILEVNTSPSSAPQPFLPSVEILERYFALGGRKISLGSDAHGVGGIISGRERAKDALKKIGFTHVTVPVCGEHVQFEL